MRKLKTNVMKKVLLILLLITFTNVSGQNNNNFWQKDKVGHAVGVFAISTATYTFLSIHKEHRNLSELQKRLISFSAGMIMGILKEAGDSMQPGNKANWGDMKANTIGALSFQISISIPLVFKKRRN